MHCTCSDKYRHSRFLLSVCAGGGLGGELLAAISPHDVGSGRTQCHQRRAGQTKRPEHRVAQKRGIFALGDCDDRDGAHCHSLRQRHSHVQFHPEARIVFRHAKHKHCVQEGRRDDGDQASERI